MDDGVEFTGKTVEDAVANAEQTLGFPRSELAISVITAGRSGVFGIGSEPARIAVRAPAQEQVEDDVMPIPAVSVEEVMVAEQDATVELDRSSGRFDSPDEFTEEEFEAEDEAQEPVPSSADLAEQAREVLLELLDVMHFDAEVAVQSVNDPILLEVTGENLGVLIGRRGDNLAALQFMVNLILSKNRRHWPRVVVDIENYRAKREDSLRGLADRIASRVRRNGRAFTLDAMPAGDRRIIHLTLRSQQDVETYSIGEGPSRRVVVAPKRIDGDDSDIDEYDEADDVDSDEF